MHAHHEHQPSHRHRVISSSSALMQHDDTRYAVQIVLRRLREVGITGIAFGAFGEASDDAHRLFKIIAAAGAEARWADAMADSAFAYRSVLVAQLRRLWGCFLARENARLKIARIEHVTGAGNRTHAARGQSRHQRARDDANFFLFHRHGARGSPSSWGGGGQLLPAVFSVAVWPLLAHRPPRPALCFPVFACLR